MPFVRVAFSVPLRQTSSYSVPDALIDAAVPGAEVRCRSALASAAASWSSARRPPIARRQPIAGVVGDTPAFQPDLGASALWIADYYLAPIGACSPARCPRLEGSAGSRAAQGARSGRAAPRPAPGRPGRGRGRDRAVTTAPRAAADAITDARAPARTRASCSTADRPAEDRGLHRDRPTRAGGRAAPRSCWCPRSRSRTRSSRRSRPLRDRVGCAPFLPRCGRAARDLASAPAGRTSTWSWARARRSRPWYRAWDS